MTLDFFALGSNQLNPIEISRPNHRGVDPFLLLLVPLPTLFLFCQHSPD